MASDHEADVGKLTEEREEARAEVRSLKSRIEKLEDQPAPRVDEKALRDKVEAEFSEKLQTLVSHMASDHETDVGNLTEEREAARAEVRNLSLKITSLQAKLRDLEEAPMRNAPTQPMAALLQPPPQPPEPEEQKARADVLQFAEQAFEAYRRATSPGTEPLPPIEEKRYRILIVHHDPALRVMWRDSLTKSGFDVQTAADGQEGLRLTGAEKPDAVIADVSMPKMSGGELCHLIKSNPETADVKVVLLTGVYTNEMPLDMATKRYEADELLRKPVRIDAIKAALTSILAKAS
jgi:CheY-like chemotaxis protein/cell division protein FtsB